MDYSWTGFSQDTYRHCVSPAIFPNHPVTTGVFFDEFSDYLESIILSSELLLITGDFNIHVNVVGDPHKLKLPELLETMGLQQHVITPTHESGNTLDLIITRQCEDLVKETSTIGLSYF